jgi:SH3-like domain-containing protein
MMTQRMFSLARSCSRAWLARGLVLGVLAAALLGGAVADAAPRKVPYWGSLAKDKVNMREGPGEDYRIRFEYHRQLWPVRVTNVAQNYAHVEDAEGARGWVLIRGKGAAEIHAQAGDDSPVLWKVEPGVVGRVLECKDVWCRLDIGKHIGFVRKTRLWGAIDK